MKNFNTKDLNNLLKTGIYKILCIENNKLYIGSASSINNSPKKNGFYRRWHEHIYKLNANKHANRHLQSSWNKHGEDAFLFEIIELCNPQECEERELYYINKFDVCNHEKGFNMIKQSNFKNNYFSPEHRNKIKNALTGKKRPQNVVEKWSKRVVQIDKNTLEIIAEYYSMAEASRQTGIQRQDIGQSIIGKKCKTAGGYLWKIVKDIV